jgi:hypothetical protein
VFAYNHQDYILEHLESIKYLIQNYGSEIDVDLIVNDDCSHDQTRMLIDHWLSINSELFRSVKTIYNSKNIGTCSSVNNALSHLVADRCKLTAGDDVYSFENIFELTKCESNVAMVSGYALYLHGDELTVDRMAVKLATITQVIYKNNTLLHRFKHFSYNNAPNILYDTECLLNTNVREFLRNFDVVEDWPLQIAIAREFPDFRFSLIENVLVYYRRTSGSTYLVANQRFSLDKNKIYNNLIINELKLFERIRLISRRCCFNSKNFWIRKFLNLDAYFFLWSYVTNYFAIKKIENKINFDLKSHREHYVKIRNLANHIIFD